MKKIKVLLLTLVAISIAITNSKVFTQEATEENPFPECPKYVGDLNKRGNVKNTAEAFDLLLVWDDKIKDSIVSTSFLKEKGKPDDFYAPWKANDKNKNTVWAEGTKGDGIGEKIYINIVRMMAVEQFKPITLSFSIINGCAVSETLFNSNNRVKKAKLTIYETRGGICGAFFKRRSDIVINNYKIIDLPDTSSVQSIQMKIPATKPVKKLDENIAFDPSLLFFMAELEILEVYKGTKYSDTCITEFSAEDDF